MNDFRPTEETLTGNSPIQLTDTGTITATWTITYDGREVSRITKPIIDNGREVPLRLLVARYPEYQPTPNPLYMELFI